MNETINFEITLNTLMYLLGLIAAAGAATAVISRWLSPYKKLKEDVANKVDKAEFEALKKEVKTVTDYQDEDHDTLKRFERGNEVICKCILAITDHELTGNGKEQLKRAKEEMQNYLIEK